MAQDLARSPSPTIWHDRTFLVGAGSLVVVLIGYVASSPLVFGPVVAALVLFAAASPAGAIAAVPAVAGLTYQPLHVLRLEFSPAEIMVGTCAGGAILSALLRRPNLGRLRCQLGCLAREQRGLGLAGVALVALGTLSLFTLARTEYRHESLRQYRWVILEPVLFFVLARHYLIDRRARALAAGWFVLGAVVASVAGLADLARGGGVAVEGVTRITGFYPHPNALALYLERPLVFAAVLAVAFRRRVAPAWLATAAVMAVALLITYSRGAALATAVVVVVAAAVTGGRRLALGLAGLSLVLGVGLAVVARDRVANLFSGGSGSLRLDLWHSAVAMIRDHPVFGIGLDQFLYVYTPRYIHPRAWSERFTSHPHDIVLDLWLNLGILALVLAAGYVILLAARTRRLVQLRSPLGLAAVAALAVGALHGLVDNGYFLPDLALLFWFATALVEIEADAPRANRRET